MQTFRSRVIDTINKTKTMLCVGLDPDPARMQCRTSMTSIGGL